MKDNNELEALFAGLIIGAILTFVCIGITMML
jgi:hypothetical protein